MNSTNLFSCFSFFLFFSFFFFSGLLAGLSSTANHKYPYPALKNRILEITQAGSIISSLPYGASTVVNQEIGFASSVGVGTKREGFRLTSGKV